VDADARDWVLVTDRSLELERLVEWATRDDCGAVVSFIGTVRNSSTHGHDVIALEYESDESLAVPRIEAVLAEARVRWPEAVTLGAHHRTGLVALGGTTVAVVAASPHRTAAFEAARFLIDAVKRTVPMWKREIWEGGSAWSEEAVPILDVDAL